MSVPETPPPTAAGIQPASPMRPARLTALVDKTRHLMRGRLWLQILIGMVAGGLLGAALAPSGLGVVAPESADAVAAWLALPGRVFLALTQMVIVPLIVVSILLGIAASGDPARLRRLGLRLALYFVGTTTLAVAIGLLIAWIVRPGDFIDPALVQSMLGPTQAAPAAPAAAAPLTDRIVNLIPTNPLAAALERSMLELVIFGMIVGVALVAIPIERAKPIVELAGSVQELTMRIVGWAMRLAPLAVFGLIAQITLRVGLEALLGLGIYVGTVLAGLAALLLVYLVLVMVLGRRSPWSFLAAAREAQLLAFATSSSAAVMPLSMKTAQERLGVRPATAQFVVPLGATINMDGTALYQVIAAMFLAQIFGVELSLPALLALSVTTIGASIGAPSTPGVGIVILATILAGIGVPVAGIALIMGVDRILDMSRTTVNVTGDLVACVVLDRWMGGELGGEPAAPPSGVAA